MLQFVAAGAVRYGEEDEARPWEKLSGFEVGVAGELYNTPLKRALYQVAGKKNAMTGGSCPVAWCNWRPWRTPGTGWAGTDQLAMTGRLGMGSSLHGAMVSSVM
jgi:hypothetical protein